MHVPVSFRYLKKVFKKKVVGFIQNINLKKVVTMPAYNIY